MQLRTPLSRTRAAQESPGDDELKETFEESVAEGEQRLGRTWPALLATGMVGGIDVGIGAFAFFLVSHDTHNHLLAALAFGIGFVALTLAGSELFTENFLVPIAAVLARRARPVAILRLWAGTLVGNFAGGWALMWIAVTALPRIRPEAVAVGRQYVDGGIGASSFASAVLGGAVLTLMTWMERGTKSVPAKLIAAVGAAFLLVAGPLNHAVVSSLELFAALHAGAPFGYAAWLELLGWYTAGNLVGGLLLVTTLRFVQVGSVVIAEQRDQADETTGPGD